MARRIDTQARNESIRLEEQVADPAAPAAGYWSLYAKSNGMYIKNSAGGVYGPFQGYAQYLIVSKSGGDYDSIQDAIDSISDAGDTKRYLVFIAPGMWNAEQIVMEEYVDIRGAGKHATQISYASDTGAIVLADYCQIEDIVIRTTTTATNWAIVGTDVGNWHVRNVDILSPNNTLLSQGIKCTGNTWKTAFIEHCVMNMYTKTGYGIYLTGDGGIIDTTINDVFLDTFEATTGGGVYLDNVDDIQIHDSFFRTTAAGFNLKTATGGSVDVWGSHFEFGTDSIEVGASTTLRIWESHASSWSNSGTIQGVIEDIDNFYQERFGAASQIRYFGTAGGGGEGITYNDSGSVQRFGLIFPGSDVVALANRAANGVTQLRGNTAVAGAGGEVTALEAQDDNVQLKVKTLINDTADTDITIGLTINQAGNDDKILTVKSSDVSHGMTTQCETDTYGFVTKTGADDGGLKIVGLNEVTIGLNLHGYGVTDDTARTTGAIGYVNVNAAKKTGTTVGGCGANANLFTVRDNGATRFLVDAEGDIHMDATSNINAWDDHNDIMLLTGLRASLMPDGHELKRQFADWIENSREILEHTGVVTYNEDGHHFIAMQKMNMLLIDTIRQLYDRILALEDKLS